MAVVWSPIHCLTKAVESMHSIIQSEENSINASHINRYLPLNDAYSAIAQSMKIHLPFQADRM